MRSFLEKFWRWYERNLKLNNLIVALLFGWQLIHLFWLTTEVVASRILGYPLYSPSEIYRFLLILADYAEIPALIGGSIFYFNSFKKARGKRDLWFLILINSQWLHILWITDEFVIKQFGGAQIGLPIWLAWIAILIDYLELPVIYDTIKNFFKGIYQNRRFLIKTPY